MDPQENINLHSEELNEALGTPPSWVARFGVGVAYVAIAVLIGLSFLIKYPDVVTAKMELTVPHPSTEILARQTGLIEKVYVDNNDLVEPGQLLMLMSSNARLSHIDSLARQLRNLPPSLNRFSLQNYKPAKVLQLGEIAEEYAIFLRLYATLTLGAMDDSQMEAIKRLNDEVKSYNQLIVLEQTRLNDLSLRLKMVDDAKERIKKVYASDAKRYAAELDAAALKVKEIEAEQADANKNIRKYQSDIQQANNRMADVRQRTGDENQDLILQFQQTVKNLNSQIARWKSNYLITAPVAGRVVFDRNFDQDNQSVRKDQKVLEVYPAGDVGEIYAKVKLGAYNSGSVEVGQEVIIKVDNYPHARYGKLKGVVQSKDDIKQEDNTYLAKVALTDGLITSFNKELDFVQGMQGTAEIITKRKRLLYRLFDNVFADLHP